MYFNTNINSIDSIFNIENVIRWFTMEAQYFGFGCNSDSLLLCVLWRTVRVKDLCVTPFCNKQNGSNYTKNVENRVRYLTSIPKRNIRISAEFSWSFISGVSVTICFGANIGALYHKDWVVIQNNDDAACRHVYEYMWFKVKWVWFLGLAPSINCNCSSWNAHYIIYD